MNNSDKLNVRMVVACPDCSNDVIVKVENEDFSFYDGSYFEDPFCYYEFICPNCGFKDDIDFTT